MRRRISRTFGIVALTLLSVFQSGSLLWAHHAGPSHDGDTDYYPLAVGNRWTFKIVLADGSKSDTVTWYISRVWKAGGKKMCAILPKPMAADDELRNYQADSSGVFDTLSESYVLKFPLKQYNQWSDSRSDSSAAVLQVNVPCESGNFKFADCLVVERDEKDRNNAAARTIAFYAKHIGPVKYVHSKFPDGTEHLLDVLVLQSYSVGGKSSSK